MHGNVLMTSVALYWQSIFMKLAAMLFKCSENNIYKKSTYHQFNILIMPG